VLFRNLFLGHLTSGRPFLNNGERRRRYKGIRGAMWACMIGACADSVECRSLVLAKLNRDYLPVPVTFFLVINY
jgi:hypothetical protein